MSIFPVAFAGGLKFEGPICNENGTAESWHVSWIPLYLCISNFNLLLCLHNFIGTMIYVAVALALGFVSDRIIYRVMSNFGEAQH